MLIVYISFDDPVIYTITTSFSLVIAIAVQSKGQQNPKWFCEDILPKTNDIIARILPYDIVGRNPDNSIVGFWVLSIDVFIKSFWFLLFTDL